MSANNWTACPKCLQNTSKELSTKEARVKEGYGAIEQDAFFGLLEDIKALKYKLEKEDTTLREDYEIYMQATGELYISYSGYCQVCKWHYTYKESIEALKCG